MTSTLDPQTAPDVTPAQRVDAWLADFEAALAVRDIDRVAGMFAVDSFWRDLVSFTWNLKTMEGREQITDMLTTRLAGTDPSGFRARETPTEDEGVTTAFIEFETEMQSGVAMSGLQSSHASGCAFTSRWSGWWPSLSATLAAAGAAASSASSVTAVVAPLTHA